MSKEQFIRIDKKGTKRYYSDRKMTTLHREDGPAVEWFEGSKYWYIDGKLHREDGPACEWADERRRSNEWYINGKRHREEEFNARMNPVELTLDEVADKFGASVDRLKIKK